MNEQTPLEQFLDHKRDYSPFLVHLTKDNIDNPIGDIIPAKEILTNILDEKSLKAFNHYCYFSPVVEKSGEDVANRFRVVCFTETPIDQIHILLNSEIERKFKPKPYGLVFKKEYLKSKGGNPVFYVTKEIAKPLWQLVKQSEEGNLDKDLSIDVCKLLALVTVCELGNDWHWEREWRTVGDLQFKLDEVFCGLCPEGEIEDFEKQYQLAFISPNWGTSKILENLILKRKQEPPDFPF